MNVNSLKVSKFLKQDDLQNDEHVVTIKGLTKKNVAKEGEPVEERWMIMFNEFAKPMVLNTTNGQLIAKFLRSEETDTWTGQKIGIYVDPSVAYAGKIVGGIRVKPAARVVKNAAVPADTTPF